MRVRTSTHPLFISFLPYTLLLSVIASWCGGCALRLPAPKIYHSQLTDTVLLKRLCPSENTTVAFSLEGDTHASGAISCDHTRTTVVLLNNVGMRVRTITISATGAAQDEVSYLSRNHTPIEELLSLLARARKSTGHTAKSHELTARISVTEPLAAQREKERTQAP